MARRLRREGRIAEYARRVQRRSAALRWPAGDEHRAWVLLHHVALAEIALGNVEQAVDVMRDVVEQIRRRGLLREMWQQVAMHALREVECGIERGDPRAALPAVREAIALLRVQGCAVVAGRSPGLAARAARRFGCRRAPAWAGPTRRRRQRNAQARARSCRRRATVWPRASRSISSADRLARLQADGAALRDDEMLAIALREPG